MLWPSGNSSKKIAVAAAAFIFFAGVPLVFLHAALGGFLWHRFHRGDAALFFDPDAGLAVEIGNYYFNVGGEGAYDPGKADHFFSKALAVDPNVPDAWHQRARISFLRGDFNGALQKINKQISIHGGQLMSSYYIRGLIYGYSGQLDKAVPDFEKFLSWDKTNWAGYNDLAWIYFEKGDFQKSGKFASGGLKYNPGNPWLLTMKGMSLLNLGDKAGAKKILESALTDAEALTEADWNKAYPGNDPASAKTALSAMINAIKYDLSLTPVD